LGGTMSPSALATASGNGTDNPGAEEEAPRAETGRPADAAAPVAVLGDPPSSAAIPAAAAAAPGVPTVDVAELLARGDGYLGKGDVTSARLFYERAADAGSRQAAMRLGATFDANFLDRAGFTGTRGDQARADMWYHRARGLGTAEAGREPQGREPK
jgi:TPR repeat protein